MHIMTQATDPKSNQLLAALQETDWQRLQPCLEPVEMPLGQVLYESGRPMSHVYFPTTSIVSLLYVMENGASAEIAVVGYEGVVGSPCSWVGAPHRVVEWCKAREWVCGSVHRGSRMNSTDRGLSCTCCCAIPRR